MQRRPEPSKPKLVCSVEAYVDQIREEWQTGRTDTLQAVDNLFKDLLARRQRGLELTAAEALDYDKAGVIIDQAREIRRG